MVKSLCFGSHVCSSTPAYLWQLCALEPSMADVNWETLISSMLHLGPYPYDDEEQHSCLNLGPSAPYDDEPSSAWPPVASTITNIPGLKPDAFCSRTNPSVILRDDDFDSDDAMQHHVRDALVHFDELMMPTAAKRSGYMAHAARFKAEQLMLLADALEHEANKPTLSVEQHMRRAWLVGRIDRAMNLCWYERPQEH